ncbi:MAG: Ycf66 family protein, partial [Cyanobacteria bacterium J06607_10]
MAAFFYPEVHRRSDFLWSGLGMFYALILWFCAGQMSPAILLGQTAAVVLLLGLGWQTLSVRREKTPVYQQTPVVLTPEVVSGWAKNKLNQLRIAPDSEVRPVLARSLNSATTKRLRQSLDPRRRPVYDYEFVEDGLLETAENLFEEPVKELNSAAAIT